MIRTFVVDCKLNRNICDSLNQESARIYTSVCVYHWRTYRKKGIWISRYDAQRINDSLYNQRKLHAHTIDAAQDGFYKACKTTQASRKMGIDDARYPYKRKRFRTTIWKSTAIKHKENKIILSNGKNAEKIQIELDERFDDVLRILEVRLVYEKRAAKYFWHLVVENGKQPKENTEENVVSIDMGEIHPAVIGDEEEAIIIACRKMRHEKQGYNKRRAKLNKKISKTKLRSRRRKRLCRTRSRLNGKHKRVMRDMEHKVSRAIVDFAVERKAKTIALGDVRNIGNKVHLGKKTNQKISQWSHGSVRRYIEYKAETEGITVKAVKEHYTSQTCPNCGKRHKPKGRVYLCPACKFQSHRDVVGQVNILSVYKHGKPGKIQAPTIIKHRIPYNIRVMRRCQDTGQGFVPCSL